MAYYTALINAWNLGTVPANYTGTVLTGLTTADKLTAINGWTTTGSVPTNFFVTGDQLANCINFAEFAALTAQQQSSLLNMCQIPGKLLGGSATTAYLPAGMFVSYFPLAGPTITALTALAKGAITPWWQNNGYTSPINAADLVGAGGLT